jgi:hypothetical protein
LAWAKLSIDSLLNEKSRGIVVDPPKGLFHLLEQTRKRC